MQLTKNFTVSELSRSEAAIRKGMDNTPPPEVVENLRALAENVLQPLRDKLGKPLRINSGYRSPAVNRAIGSGSSSQHTRGEAADIEFPGMDTKALASIIVSLGLPYDQLILEFYVPGDPSSGWVHVSHKRQGPQRKETLRAVKQNGTTIYLKGLE